MSKEPKIGNHCVDGKCSNCGNCCTGVSLPLRKNEASIIAKYIKNNGIKQQHREWVKDVMNNQIPSIPVDTRCCFYDSVNKKCLIYPVRPGICRKFQCNQDEAIIVRNKEVAHKIAYYNQGSSGLIRATNFDLLFYGDVDSFILVFYFVLNKEGLKVSLDKVIDILRDKMCEYTYGIS